MANLATIVNNILADSGIDDINVVVTTGSYTNPAWIVSLPWTKITGTPTTLAGYGITDAVTTNTAQTITGVKTFNSGSLILAAEGTANSTHLRNSSGDGTSVSGSNVFGFNSSNNIYVRTVSKGGFVFNFNNGAANRTYTFPDADGTIALVGGTGVGTVTSVAALTLGTSGTDLSSTVANGTTTPVITLNVPTASATNRGALSAADWTTFNNKQNALTNPVTGTGTTNYLPKFTGTSTIGNSIVQDDATTVTVGGQLYVNRNDSNVIKVARNGGSNLNTVIEFANASSSVHIGSNGTLFGLGGTTGSVAAQPFIIVPSSTEKMRLDASGNLGLGVTPSAWFTNANVKAFEIGYKGNAIYGVGGSDIRVISNAFFDGAYKYADVGPSSVYQQNDGIHRWFQAPSGTAGNAISFTQAMTLTSGGNLLVGTTTDNGARLQVSGGVHASSLTDGFINIGAAQINRTGGFVEMQFSGSSGVRFFGNTAYPITFASGTGAATFSSSVGIGGSPVLRLDVQGNASDTTIVSGVTVEQVSLFRPSNGVGGIRSGFNTSTGDAYLWSAQSGSSLNFGTRSAPNNTAHLSITSGGNVGIGTSSPAAELQVGKASDVVIAMSNSSSVTSGSRGSLAFYNSSVSTVALIRATAITDNVGTQLEFYTRPVAGSLTQAMTLNPSGNLGLGVTPSAWQSFRGLQVGQVGAFASNDFGGGNIQTFIGNNVYYDNAGFKYIQSGTAAMYRMGLNGEFQWLQTSTSGTAGNAISFTQAMTLGSNGGLSIGTPSAAPAQGLLVTGAATFSSSVTAGGDVNLESNESYVNLFSTYVVGMNARARIRAVGAGGGSGYGGDFRIDTRAQNNVWNQNAFVVDSGGNVGIGTTSPSAKLEVNSNSNLPIIRARYDGSYFTDYDTNGIDFRGTAQNYDIKDNGNVAIRIASGRNVLINTTTDNGARLQVDGGVTVQGNTNLGNSLGSTLSSTFTTRLSGFALRADVSNRYGNYGVLILNSDSGWTGSARRFMITNGIGSNKFGIIRSVDANTDPALGDGGSISSGTVDFEINNTGAATFSSSLTAGVGSFTGDSAQVLTLHKTSGGGSQLLMTTTFGNSYGISPFIAGISNGGFSITDITNNVQRLVIQENTGNVGIGTASPARTLEVNGFISAFDGTTRTEIINGGGVGFIGTATNHPVAFQTNNAERMRITSGGNVGIGTASPNNLLQVGGTTNGIIRIDGAGDGVDFGIKWALSNASIYSNTSNAYLTFATNGGERMRITSGGNVGIGTTSPNYLLHIAAGAANPQLQFTSTGTGSTTSDGFHIGVNNSTLNAFLLQKENAALQILTNDTERMRITSGGNVGIGTASPTARLQVVGEYIRLVNSADSQNILLHADTSRVAVSAPNGNLAFDTANVERMRIISNGNVGIGTPSPASRFQSNNSSTFNSSTATGAIVASNLSGGNAIVDIGVDTSFLGYIQSRNISSTTVYNLLLNPLGGNVGIGTTSPDVFGRFYTQTLGLSSSGSTAIQINGGSGGYGQIDFGAAGVRTAGISASANETQWGSVTSIPAIIYTNGSERMRITSGGNVLIGTTTTPAAVSGVSFPLTVSSSAATRIRIDSTNASPNSGVGLYANGVQKFSFAMYGATSDFTIYNDALLAPSLTVKGNNSNVLIGTTTDTSDKLRVDGNTFTNTITTYRPGVNTTKSDAWKLGRASIGTQPTETHQITVEIGGVSYVIGAAQL